MTTTPDAHHLLRLKLSETHEPSPDRLSAEVYRGETLLTRWVTRRPGPEWMAVSRETSRRQRGSHSDPARDYTLPDDLESSMRSLAPMLKPDDVVWIELGRPKGRLAVLPWERWLSPLIERPLLRLPRYPFKPVRPGGGLHIAYCSSAAIAKNPFDVVNMLFRIVDSLNEAGLEATFHIFLDGEQREHAREHARRLSGHVRMEFHVPPAELSDDTGNYVPSNDPLSSPWLRWIAAELPSRGVDVVHFVSHGYLSNGRGAIALARHPAANDDAHWARFVNAPELVRLLDVSGASAVVLTSPRENFSVSGLLALADELIACRPGPVVFHDAAADFEGDAIGRAMSFLYGYMPPPISPALAVCAHPDHVQPAHAIAAAAGAGDAHPPAGRESAAFRPVGWQALYQHFSTGPFGQVAAEAQRKLFDKFTLARTIQDQTHDTETSKSAAPDPAAAAAPAPSDDWLVSCQRVLERHTARLSSAPLQASEVGRAAQKGAAEALEFVKGLLESKEWKGKGL